MARIVAAAIQLLRGGLVVSVPPPGRHHTIIHALVECGAPAPIGGCQGFLTDSGAFVDRYQAMGIAVAANQLIPRTGQYGPDGPLFSEDLW